MGVGIGLELLGHLGQGSRLQHIDDQYTMMSSEGTATLGDDVRMRNPVLVGSLDKGIDAVVDILLDGVVDRALAGGRTGTVVVDTQSTATVNEVDIISHLMQLHIEL